MAAMKSLYCLASKLFVGGSNPLGIAIFDSDRARELIQDHL